MDEADLAFCQQYFQSEGRCPTITEIKMIDTYWSDHCRHTTFGTEMTDVAIDDPRVQAASTSIWTCATSWVARPSPSA